MLERINLKNFKSFQNFSLNLNNSKDNIAAIYGENGSGKSNLISALVFLKASLNTMNHIGYNETIDDKLNEAINKIYNYQTKEELQGVKTIGSSDAMELEYEFLINNKSITYRICYSDNKIIEESLKAPLIKYQTEIFKITSSEIRINKNLFTNREYKAYILKLLKESLGRHSLLAILNREFINKHLDKKINQIIPEVLAYLNDIIILYKDMPRSFNDPLILDSFKEGIIINSKENLNRLKRTEALLNYFFTSLYSDFKELSYDISFTDDDISYKLYFHKQIGENKASIPWNLESTGTLRLLDVFLLLFEAIKGKTVLIDEIDTGIHDLLMLEIIKNLKDKIKGELIFTTHNSLLIDELSPESVFILNIDSLCNKTISPISDIERIQATHKVSTRYLKGIYGGIPFTGYLDFSYLLDLEKNYKNEK